MSRELVISMGPGEVRAGVFVDDRAVDLILERAAAESLVGAVFLGRVLRVLPALPGAFVDLGLSRPAFLPGRHKLAEGAALMVQVVKDAFADKAAELSTSIELRGALLVWTPQRPGVFISRRLPPALRAGLSTTLAALVHDGEGVTIRQDVASGDPDRLRDEVAALRSRHQQIRRAGLTARPPSRLDAADDPLAGILAAAGAPPDRILIDDLPGLARLRRLVPECRSESAAAGAPEMWALDEAFAAALAPQVRLPGGARLWIESGVAFTSIDVDLGMAAVGRRVAAEVIRRVNIDAAEALAREIRRRNIGGAIVVDFVSMPDRRHRQDVEAVLSAAVADDPAGVQLHGWTRLDHCELTRRRVRPSLADLMLEPAGPRRPKTPRTVGLEVLRAFAGQAYAPTGLRVRAHPRVTAALMGELSGLLVAAQDRQGQRLDIDADPGCPVESFDIHPG